MSVLIASTVGMSYTNARSIAAVQLLACSGPGLIVGQNREPAFGKASFRDAVHRLTDPAALI